MNLIYTNIRLRRIGIYLERIQTDPERRQTIVFIPHSGR